MHDSRHCTSYHINWIGCEASDCHCKESISEFTDYKNQLSGNTYIHGVSKSSCPYTTMGSFTIRSGHSNHWLELAG